MSRIFLLIPLAALLHAAAQTTSVQPFTVQGVGAATVTLDGRWQFRISDDLAWADPGLDDSQWEAIDVNRSWGEQSHFGYFGFAWYRRHISVTPVTGAQTEFALFVPPADDAYEVYWNGKRVGQSGQLPPHPVWYFQQPYRTFGLGSPQSGVLAIRVWKAPFASFDAGTLGGLTRAPQIGSTAAIAAYKEGLDHRWLRSKLYDGALNLFYVLIGVGSLLAWVRNRRQKILFWMALFAITFLLAQILTQFRIPFPFAFSIGVLQPLLGLEDVSLSFLLLYLLQLDNNPRLRRWTVSIAIIAITASSLDGVVSFLPFDWLALHRVQWVDAGLTAIVSLMETFPLVLIAFALRKRLDRARWFLAIAAFLRNFLIVLRTGLSQGERYTHWTLGDKLALPLFTIGNTQFNAMTVLTTLLFIAIVYAVYRYVVEQTKRQGSLEQEFKSAQEVQRILIPETLPAVEGYSITSAYRPADEVGGDFFQLIPLASQSTLLILGDVSGKGLKAAMTVSFIVGSARTLADLSEDPSEILSGLNRRLHGRLQNGFVTCLIARLDADGTCVLANAGHPAPFLNAQEVNLPPALPLGVLPVAGFETTLVRLGVGDRLTLYTDGLLEARNPAGELFSFERVQQLMATRPDARQASEAAVAFGQDDDITVLTVTRLATGVQSSTLFMANELAIANG